MQTSTPAPRFFNVNSLIDSIPDFDGKAETADFYVSCLAYKNFDFVLKRLPFLTECSVRGGALWEKFVAAADERYWIRDAKFGIAVYNVTEHCGTPRTYRLAGDYLVSSARSSASWVELPTEDSFYSRMDTPAARAVFEMWQAACSKASDPATGLADGRHRNTAVDASIIMFSPTGCLICGASAPAYAATTLGAGPSGAGMLQFPLCENHLEVVKSHPSVMAFLESIFKIDLNLPHVIKSESIPDGLIEMIHSELANQLGGVINRPAELRKNGWFLEVKLPSDWRWQLRLRSLMDYAYLLFQPGVEKAVYQADSAAHHPELPYPPNHEHSQPKRKGDVASPSFLYGLPLFDLRRLLEISVQHGALPGGDSGLQARPKLQDIN